jgi:hypothetical protein
LGGGGGGGGGGVWCIITADSNQTDHKWWFVDLFNIQKYSH